MANDGWTPASTPPDSPRFVLGWHADQEHMLVFYAQGRWYGDDYSPTHWRELPGGPGDE